MKVRSQVTIAALLLVSACVEWVRVETPQEALMKAKAGTIQVTKTDQSVLLINHAAIVGDSLVGTVDYDEFLRGTLLRDITSVDIPQFSLRRTGLLVGGVVMAMLVTIGILVATAPPWQF